MNETEVTTTETRAVQEQTPSFWQSVFGQVTSKKFWVEVLRVMLSEAMNACAVVLAGRLLWYGQSRRDEKTANLMAGSPGGGPSAVAQKAFGGSYTPTPSFANQPSYPVPTQPQGDVRFPGFGSQR